MKMMVVSLTRDLIARWLTWQIHRRQPALFHQRLDVPVNSSNSKSANLAPRVLKHLLRPQRAVHPGEHVADGRLLARIALQHRFGFHLRRG